MTNYVEILKFLLEERERLIALKEEAEGTKNNFDYEALTILLKIEDEAFMKVYELIKGLGIKYARKENYYEKI